MFIVKSFCDEFVSLVVLRVLLLLKLVLLVLVLILELKLLLVLVFKLLLLILVIKFVVVFPAGFRLQLLYEDAGVSKVLKGLLKLLFIWIGFAMFLEPKLKFLQLIVSCRELVLGLLLQTKLLLLQLL